MKIKAQNENMIKTKFYKFMKNKINKIILILIINLNFT